MHNSQQHDGAEEEMQSKTIKENCSEVTASPAKSKKKSSTDGGVENNVFILNQQAVGADVYMFTSAHASMTSSSLQPLAIAANANAKLYSGDVNKHLKQT